MATTLSRRNFLKGVAAGAASIAAMGVVGSAPKASAEAAESAQIPFASPQQAATTLLNPQKCEIFRWDDAPDMASSILFKPWQFGSLTIENRLVKSAAGSAYLPTETKENIIAEYFTEHRTNILMDRAFIPSTMGLTAAVRANVGEARARGVDIQADYQQVWSNDFWTSARANFTWARSKFDVYEEPNYPERWRSRIGYSLAQNWGYIAERLFVDDAEAANSPSQASFGSLYGGGDIKYTDVNRDGKIDQKDMVPIGNPTSPEIIYGFGFSAGWKGFDASVFFQGLANESFWINASATSPFQGQTQLLKVYADSHWSEDNRDVYALWPRLSNYVNSNNVQSSTWFMRDGSFLRLKQVEFGYTLPRKLTDRAHIDNLRLYLSGSNLWTWSRFRLWDVEMAGNGLGYPIQRIMNIGLNITFK